MYNSSNQILRDDGLLDLEKAKMYMLKTLSKNVGKSQSIYEKISKFVDTEYFNKILYRDYSRLNLTKIIEILIDEFKKWEEKGEPQTKINENMNKIEKLKELVDKKVIEILTEAKKKAKTKKAKSKSKPKAKKKLKMEGTTTESFKMLEKNDLGKFWVVTNPLNTEDKGHMFETDIFNFSEKVQNGSIKYENIRAIVAKEDRAKRIGERLMRERMAAVGDAKSKAEQLKNLKSEVISKAKALKKTKQETLQAVKSLQEAIKRKK